MNDLEQLREAELVLMKDIISTEERRLSSRLTAQQEEDKKMDELNMKFFFDAMGNDPKLLQAYLDWIEDQKAKGKLPQEISSIEYYKSLKGTLYF